MKYQKQTSNKASGIDKMTKEKYEENLYNNIDNLLQRMKKFSYKSQAVRRTYIPKVDYVILAFGYSNITAEIRNMNSVLIEIKF